MNSDRTNAGASHLPGFWRPVDNWAELAGQNIEIHERGTIVDRGQVEVTTADGDILWLSQQGAVPRRLWEQSPGRHVRIVPLA